MARRAAPKDRLTPLLSPRPRFLAGLLAMPGFLLIDDPRWKALLVFLYGGLAWASGKRIRILYFVLTLATVTFFHLLTPWGVVLAEWGPLRITSGALEKGLLRGLTLVGMVFLSLSSVRPDLQLPGRFGGILGRTFRHFETIIDGKGRLSRKNFLGSLDRLLIERFDPGKPDFGLARSDVGTDVSGDSNSWRGTMIAVWLPGITWALWALTRSGFL